MSNKMFFAPIGGVLDADAEAFLIATSISDSTITSAINTLVIDLKANGLWTKFYFLYPMVGGTSSTHSYNLKNTSLYQLTFNGGWVHSSNGALPNGTDGFANTGFTPNGTVSQNSFGISYYSKTNNLLTPNNIIMGCAGSNSPLSAVTLSSFGTSSTYLANNDYSFPLIASSGSLGLTTINRTGSSVCNYWRTTTKTVVNISSTNTPNRSIFLGANNAEIAQQFSSYECAFSSAQQGFTDSEIVIFNNIVQTFQTALGRQV